MAAKSDDDLRDGIQMEVERQWGGRANDIDVQVLKGAVTLTGTLQSDLEKWNLCDAIGDMAGVESLIDETRVVSQPSMQSLGADVARPWFTPG